MDRINYVFLSLLEDKQQSKFGVVMTSHLTLFLGCFVTFSIFESLILVFPKHSNFRGFLK